MSIGRVFFEALGKRQALIAPLRRMDASRECQAAVKASRWLIGPWAPEASPAVSVASVIFFHLANRGASVSRTPYLTGIRWPAAGATPLRFAKVGLAEGSCSTPTTTLFAKSLSARWSGG